MMISISLLFNLLIIYYVNLVWGLGPLHICATLLEELWLTSVLLITEVNQSLQLKSRIIMTIRCVQKQPERQDDYSCVRQSVKLQN